MRGILSVKKRENVDCSVDNKHEYVIQIQDSTYKNINGTIPISIVEILVFDLLYFDVMCFFRVLLCC